MRLAGLLLVLVGLTGCSRPIRSEAIIDRYKAAECIGPISEQPKGPTTRTWDNELRTPAGVTVQIRGTQMPGGLITVEYPGGRVETAADAHEYVYPADVRYDRATGHLYVKADGVDALFAGREVWLFEYDLDRRKQVQRHRVAPEVLPPQCPVSSTNASAISAPRR